MQDPVKEAAWSEVDATRPTWSAWHTHIWHLAEPAWRERLSAAWYAERLEAEGFEVERGSGGMPTAISARWSNGPGPAILAYAEYDAVPGNCQDATTARSPRGELSATAPGHTDPHSALGISTLVGLLAAKHSMEASGITGTLLYTGEPAEKMQGSKVVHGLRGYYDQADAILSFHPFYMLPLCNTVRWDTHCAAYYSRVYSFVCDQPELWGSAGADSPIPQAHSSARAPGANAALAMMHLATKSMQDAMLASMGGWSLSDAILAAGNATADNLPGAFAQIQYSWRAPTVEMAEQMLAVIERNAESVAEMTGCRLETRWVARNRPGLANHVMADAVWANFAAVGAPQWSSQARALAREIQANLGLAPLEEPLLEACERLVEPREAEAELRRSLPAWQANWTSDDYTEMTWYAPTARFYVGRPTLAPHQEGRPYPGWAMNAMGGIAELIDPTIETAAKVVAGSILDLVRSPETLARAREELETRRAGRSARNRLLPRDFEAPIELNWPDYVEIPGLGRRWPVRLPGEAIR